jgi:nicotinamide mononucleotide adenylyltransferase
MEKLKPVELFLGRMQPLHNGHKKIIDSMKNPIVVIVKGKKSGADAERNPLDEEYQKKLIEMIFPGLEVSISPNGFLPGILGYFRKQGKEVTKIYAGADRIAGYQDAINRANEKMPEDQRYRVTFQETERVTSATTVRNAIKSGDKDTFKKLVPSAIWGEWDTLRKKLGVMKEGILKFGQWMEDAAVTTTVAIKDAQKDIPLGPMVRRKRKRGA